MKMIEIVRTKEWGMKKWAKKTIQSKIMKKQYTKSKMRTVLPLIIDEDDETCFAGFLLSKNGISALGRSTILCFTVAGKIEFVVVVTFFRVPVVQNSLWEILPIRCL